MSIAAVICEYNPFHNGHKYQLEKLRRDLDVSYIIAIMSGDYVQRGEPAIFSKELRTKWALENGIDAVLLLPLPFATASADLFSEGAVSILNRLNCIDYLCFGSESGDIDALIKCDKALSQKGRINSQEILEKMKEGMTFAKARSVLFPEFNEILDEPNNILALEYIAAINKMQSSIKPYTVKRLGEGYNDNDYETPYDYLSGSAIRNAYLNKDFQTILPHVPYDLEKIAEKPLCFNDFSKELFFSLANRKGELTRYLELSDDLAKRIENSLYGFESATSFIEELKAKNYTYNRISRSLLHIMLGIEGSNSFHKEMLKHLSHVKLLGFKESSSKLLSVLSEKSDIKIMTKLSSCYDSFNKVTKDLYDEELFAEALYNQKKGFKAHEFTKQIVIVK